MIRSQARTALQAPSQNPKVLARCILTCLSRRCPICAPEAGAVVKVQRMQPAGSSGARRDRFATEISPEDGGARLHPTQGFSQVKPPSPKHSPKRVYHIYN